LLTWTVLAFDELVDPLLLRFGGVRIEIWRPDRLHEVSGVSSPVGYRYPWPSSAEALLRSELIVDAKKHALSVASFVSDRRDLADLLLSERDVHRGDVWAHLPVGARPSRLVKAIILGRVTGDSIIEQKAIEVLEREGDRNMSWESDRPYLFRQIAGDWAEKYGAASGVDLSDVIRDGPRRRR
jgi:hypothetical protein